MKVKMPARQGTGTDALFAFLGLFFTGSARVVISVLVGRHGGPALLGITQAALSTAQLTAIAGPSSLGSAASKHIAAAEAAGKKGMADALRQMIQRWGVWLSLVVSVISGGVIRYVGFGDRWMPLVVAVLSLAFCLYAISKGVLLGSRRARRSSRLEFAVSVMVLGGVSVLLLAGVRSSLVIAPVAVGYLGYALAARMRGTKGAVSSGERKAIRGFVLLGVVGTLASAGFMQSAVLVAAYAGGPDLAGQYGASMALTAPISLVASSAGLALFPSMARLTSVSGTQLREIVRGGTEAMMFLSVTVVGPAILLSSVVVEVLWGPSFANAGRIAPLLLIAAGISMSAVPSVSALTSGDLKGMSLSMVSSISGAVLGGAMWLLLVPSEPILGIPGGYLAGTLVTALLPVVLIWRRLRMDPAWGIAWGKFLGAYALIGLLVVFTRGDSVVQLVGFAAALAVGWVSSDLHSARRILSNGLRTVRSV